ncbi:hypothetical protein BGZ61DRAFT_548526 [Ilyonectria robusta]|uniref:uncharacterized protein n=1 Tax=Ilyonectria robusta TaxID=1079257 RepID=UPI001E8D3DFA|nr:uncharacterized protein BGZ61DRAFT_548526 [Ilyonectria robusta]KAH8648232.1 hypothetical protein BGZ61DRAFT_548526 [Ilyonectria robusta]
MPFDSRYFQRSRLDSTGELLPQERSNIRRRLIYVTDLDSWSVAALIATARNGNAQELELACHIEKHLGWRSSLHASVSNLGFQLEFHLPFFAWRTSRAQIGDPRRGAGDRPLRKVRDLSFLRAESTDGPSIHDTDYLCEAQISCVLIGHHDRVWTAYCFVDTYFDLEDSKDSVNDYEDEEDFGELYPDPLSRGTLDANTPILDPRIYFLRVLETRMLQVEQEWRDLTYLVKSKVNLSIAEGKGPFVLEAADGSEALAAHRSLERICQTIVLLRTLEQSLSDIVFQWQKFKDNDVTLFLDVGGEGERALASLEYSFGELRVLERILHQLIQRCEDFMTVLNLRLTFDRTELRDHGKVVNAAQNTSTIVTVFFPPLLAAVVLSMPTSYFSSTIPTFAPFLVLTTLIFTAMLIVTIFRSSKCYRQILVSFSDFVKPHLESVPRETGFQSYTRGEPEPPEARGGIALNRWLGRQGNADVHGGHIELGRL